jgi:hypothetical protein
MSKVTQKISNTEDPVDDIQQDTRSPSSRSAASAGCTGPTVGQTSSAASRLIVPGKTDSASTSRRSSSVSSSQLQGTTAAKVTSR